LIDQIKRASDIIRGARHVTAFCGAGISVESGIPPFRGENGLWSTYDPKFLELNCFLQNPKESWELIREIFFDFFGRAEPNAAHIALARMEEENFIKAVITQNIDNLHFEAGSRKVYEYHGTAQYLVCVECTEKTSASEFDLDKLPPECPRCGGLVKPDFIFFGEIIPEPANTLSFQEAEKADIFLIIGTSGEIVPAAMIPEAAAKNGAKIIEVNIKPSSYTAGLTDVFLQGKASEVMTALAAEMDIEL